MSYIEKIREISRRLEKDSILILFSSTESRRNRDVFYPYRNNSDLLYLTGLNIPDLVFCLDSSQTVVIFMKFPDPAIERWQGKMITPAEVSQRLDVPLVNIREYKNFQSQLPELLKNRKNLYIDFGLQSEIFRQIMETINNLNKNTRDKIYGPQNLLYSGQILHEARLIKTEEEIIKIRQAIDITTIAFNDIMKWTRKNIKEPIFEYQLKGKIEEIFQRYGAMSLAYPTIVASGNNANYLHYEHCNEMITPESMVLVDAGCEWNGYASDITRTFPLSGKFSLAQRELYSIALSAQKAAITYCGTDKRFENIHNKTVETIVDGLWELGLFKKIYDPGSSEEKKLFTPANRQEVIEKKYYRLYFMHYTSHYLGLDVHDVGRYYNGSDSRTLENGMIFTVEPGIYVNRDYDFLPDQYRGIGIRIEDDILIRNNKAEVLSPNIPREVDEIEGLL